MKVVLGGQKLKHLKYCNLLSNLLKLIKFGLIVQNDELHKTLDFVFISGDSIQD